MDGFHQAVFATAGSSNMIAFERGLWFASCALLDGYPSHPDSKLRLSAIARRFTVMLASHLYISSTDSIGLWNRPRGVLGQNGTIMDWMSQYHCHIPFRETRG